MEKLLSYENVTFQRGTELILNDINWHVEKGEHWAVLGLNGSGKSTMVNMMGGYEFPSSGVIRVFGHQYGRYNWEHVKRRLGFVGNTLNRFLETLNVETAEEIVVSGKFNSIGLYEQTSEADWEKANELLNQFRIHYLKNKPYRLMSQGEQRRVLIARSIMADPEILILDEPCSGLDVRSREELIHVLNGQAAAGGQTMIFITHHIEEIIQAVTHVAVLKEGEIVASGLKKDVLTNDVLSEAFGLPVSIEWAHGRAWLKAASYSSLD